MLALSDQVPTWYAPTCIRPPHPFASVRRGSAARRGTAHAHGCWSRSPWPRPGLPLEEALALASSLRRAQRTCGECVHGCPLSVVSRVRLCLAAQAGRGATSCRVRRGASRPCSAQRDGSMASPPSVACPALPCPSVDRRASLDRTTMTSETMMSTTTSDETGVTSGRCALFLLHPERGGPVPPAWPTLPSLRVACPS